MIFRNWVLQNFPFLEDDFDALTDYELFCKMVEYMKKSLEKIESFQSEIDEFTIKLDEFQHYFDNLDVTEEVNAKLDEMVEDGTMEELIAEYLQLATTYTYNSVAEMKLAENLTNGAFTRTTGFYANGDGGEAYYKVRTITSEDVINEMSLIALHDVNLVAELIKNNVNIKQYGAKGDDTNDDTLAIQTCIDENNNVYIPKGIYKTTNSIQITSGNTTISGDGKTLAFIKKYGTNTYDGVISYDNVNFDYSDYPAIINLVFTEDTNISNVNIKNISLYDETANSNSAIIAPHISYCIFDTIRVTNCIKAIKYGGWINKIFNCDFLNIQDVSIEGVDTIYTVINGVHGNKIAVSNAKGLYINSCAFDNGNPCFEIINSASVNINNTSTETNRMVLRNTNSYVIINGGDLEGHSNSNLDLFSGFFINQTNGETYIRNANIHFDDYGNYGNPNDKNLVKNSGGVIRLIDNKITTPYTYTVYNTGTYTTQIDDKIDSSVATVTKKTGRFTKTDGISQEVLRLPFAYGKNYMLHIKSWNTGPYHTAINIDTVMTACSNGNNTGLSNDVTYTIAKPPTSNYNSYLHLEYDDANNELVLYYKSTNSYGNDVYFEIEYTNN